MKTKIYLLILSACLLTACEWTSKDSNNNLSELGPGKGIVEYTGYAPLKDKPVYLHFYIPDTDMTNLPVIFIFPGTGRNANDYLEGWLKSYRDKKAIIISLEFPAEHYSTSEYIEGNMFRNNQLVSEEQWSYSMIEPLFLYIKQQTGNTTTKYSMFGHSAGAQFVHRFVTFKQNTNLNKAIAANAGWYTVPNTSIAYPYGLKNSGSSDKSTLTHLFASNLIVALGDQDIDPNDSSLRHTAEADAQGLYRYARGKHYYSESERISKENGLSFNWKKIVVKGVAHDFSGMMEQTGSQLF